VDLRAGAMQLDYGVRKFLYTREFLRTMRQKALAKNAEHGLQIDARALRRASTFHEIDNLYTAPVHGFRSAEDYWVRSSSKPWLRHIKVPTLLINARNDPLLPGDVLPTRAEVSDAVALEFSETGGHVGFVTGRFPGHLGWLPSRILGFFSRGER